MAVLDADTVPQPDFLDKTLGYFVDERVALVQLPQEFYNVDSVQHSGAVDEVNLWHEQELFYRVIQPGKHRWGASFWCGSRRRKTVARGARVVLLAAMGYTNLDIARLVPMDEEAVGLWRRRWAKWSRVPLTALSVADRLTDAPRAGAVPRLTAEQVCQIVALACALPTDSDRPISQWSHRELADEIVRRGITDRISTRHDRAVVATGTRWSIAPATHLTYGLLSS
jgi:hypothetical protein